MNAKEYLDKIDYICRKHDDLDAKCDVCPLELKGICPLDDDQTMDRHYKVLELFEKEENGKTDSHKLPDDDMSPLAELL